MQSNSQGAPAVSRRRGSLSLASASLAARIGMIVVLIYLLVALFAPFLAPFGEVSQIREPVGKIAQRRIVHRAVHLLAVARDKRDGISFVDEIDYVLHMRFVLIEFFCE